MYINAYFQLRKPIVYMLLPFMPFPIYAIHIRYQRNICTSKFVICNCLDVNVQPQCICGKKKKHLHATHTQNVNSINIRAFSPEVRSRIVKNDVTTRKTSCISSSVVSENQPGIPTQKPSDTEIVIHTKCTITKSILSWQTTYLRNHTMWFYYATKCKQRWLVSFVVIETRNGFHMVQGYTVVIYQYNQLRALLPEAVVSYICSHILQDALRYD